MATLCHPVTGVLLNPIPKRRKSLSNAERHTARLLRSEGHKIQDIAAMLGTNQGRIVEAIEEGGQCSRPQNDPPLLI